MDKDKEKKNGKINVRDVNEVVGLSKKILHLVYIMMIIGIIFLGTLIIKEWGILSLIVTLLKVATPFFIGFVIAWLFNPIVVKLENRGWKRGIACVTVYLAFNIFKVMENLAGGIANDLPSTIVSIAGSLVSGLGTIGVSLVVGIYLLFDFNDVTDHLLKYIPKSHKEETKILVDNIANELRKCVNGTLLVAFMVFVCDSIGFAFAGLKSPILFGLLCGITDLIPYIGPYIGGAAAVIVGFSQNPIIGIITLIVATVVQLVENYVLQPVVMSKTMQLHPVTIIIGLLIFGHFFGIVGMILATPILSLFKVLYRFLANKYDWFNKDVF